MMESEAVNVSAVNELILEILKKCGCVGYANCFKGITKKAFRCMEAEDLYNQIKIGSLASIQIHQEILAVFRSHAEKIREEVLNFTKIQNKISLIDEEENEDSDIEWLPVPDPKRTTATVTAGTLKIREGNIEVISLTDEDEDEGDRDESQSQVGTQRKKRPFSESEDYSVTESENTFISIFDPSTHLKKLKRDGQYYAKEVCTKIRIIATERENSFHNCCSDPTPIKLEHWKKFFLEFGPTITSIEMNSWSWKSVGANCPYNLVTILTKLCPNLEELVLKVGLDPCESEPGRKLKERRTRGKHKVQNVDLPPKTFLKIKKIVVDVMGSGRTSGKVPGSVLSSILKASQNLQVFVYNFQNKQDLNVVLQTLMGLDGSSMDKLKCLEIRPGKHDESDDYLTANEVAKLTSLKAKNLQEIILGDGLWEDVDGSLMEKLLKNFPLLKKLVVFGNYQGNSLQKPDIHIAIPPSDHLEHLEIGGNYEFALTNTNNKHSSNSDVNDQSCTQDEAPNTFSAFPVSDSDNLKTEFFSVSLKFGYLPNLHTIILGTLFDVDDLDFARIPKITSFRAGSPWHLTMSYPSQNSRKNSKGVSKESSLKELRLPDCLKDELLIQNLPKLFPSLEKCWIFLPSVKVLKSFFKTMANSKLKTLLLRIQFDFESTLELCLVDTLGLGQESDSEESLSRQKDMKKFETVKEYGMWEKWVDSNNIELPCLEREELEELESKGDYAGLSALKSLECLRIEHVGRVLKIPKGSEDWLGSEAQFTEETIGFDKYPLSSKCVKQLFATKPHFVLANFECLPTDAKRFISCKLPETDDGGVCERSLSLERTS